MPSLDIDWEIGVPGWKHQGRLYTLKEIMELFPGERGRFLLIHEEAMVLLKIVELKLEAEYLEATSVH